MSSYSQRTSIEIDWVAQVGDGILMLAAFGTLRATLSLSAAIGFRLIDLSYFPGSWTLAMEMNRSSDPRQALSALVVMLPVFLASYWLLCRRLNDNEDLAHGKMHVIVLGLFCLDTLFGAGLSIPGFVYAIIAGETPEPALVKLAIALAAYGFLLGFFGVQLRKAIHD